MVREVSRCRYRQEIRAKQCQILHCMPRTEPLWEGRRDFAIHGVPSNLNDPLRHGREPLVKIATEATGDEFFSQVVGRIILLAGFFFGMGSATDKQSGDSRGGSGGFESCAAGTFR